MSTDQTCDPDTTCVFSRRITLKSMLDVCPIVFKITPDQVNKNVALTNAYYGEKNLGVSRIVFANGRCMVKLFFSSISIILQIINVRDICVLNYNKTPPPHIFSGKVPKSFCQMSGACLKFRQIHLRFAKISFGV